MKFQQTKNQSATSLVCPKHKSAYFYHKQKLFQQTKRRCASILVCPTITKPMLLLQTNEISADQMKVCVHFGLPNNYKTNAFVTDK